MSKTVTFAYINGTSRPSRSLPVESADTAYSAIEAFLKPYGGLSALVPGTIVYREHRKLDDPPAVRASTTLQRAMRAPQQQEVPGHTPQLPHPSDPDLPNSPQRDQHQERPDPTGAMRIVPPFKLGTRGA